MIFKTTVKIKDILRYRLKQLRGNLTENSKDEFQAVINAEVVKFCQEHNARKIFIYHPTQNEVDVTPAAKVLGGVEACLPKVQGGEMFFVNWDLGEGSLEDEGRFKQPKENTKVADPDVIFIPCLGYDLQGYRIGYGKGFYDKTLHKYPDAIKVAVAYSIQELLEVPKEAHDICVDYVINENGVSAISSQQQP